MILEQLTLRNFGVYEGTQTFNLAPLIRRSGTSGPVGRPAPLVLVGGINGGGKTTLLDAIQIVLYGNRAHCSKLSDKSYNDFLIESIHKGAVPSNHAEPVRIAPAIPGASVPCAPVRNLARGSAHLWESEIQLSFRYATEGHEHIYEVTRSWSVAHATDRHIAAGAPVRRIREQVQVMKDGVLDGWVSDNWNQLVEDLIPRGIAQLCFFDAEKIRYLAEDESSTQALGEAIKSLLGLDIAERLATDVGVLEERITKRLGPTPDATEVDRLQCGLQQKCGEVDHLVHDIAALENGKLAAQTRLQATEDRFAKIGGQRWREREDNQRRLMELKHGVEHVESQLVSLAATDIPLALVLELLCAVVNQADKERVAAESGIVDKLLHKRDDALLSHLEKEGTGAAIRNRARKYLEADRVTRRGRSDVEHRLGLSNSVRQLLEHLLSHGIGDRHLAMINLLDQLNRDRRALDEIQRTLAATPQEDVIHNVTEELKAATAELTGIDLQIGRMDKKLSSLRFERDEFQKQLRTLRKRIIENEIQSEEDTRLVALLGRTRETMAAFLHLATVRKIDHLANLITESFRYLLRKETLIHRVVIDPATFSVSLYDNAGQMVPKQRLSEGEKQIFAISVLWGLSRASARPLPAIVDTPMARLDAKHRDHLVERYFPNASHQVILLSTDTEVDQKYFETLQPSISRAYHLEYDDQRKSTVAKEGYFWKHAAPVHEATAE